MEGTYSIRDWCAATASSTTASDVERDLQFAGALTAAGVGVGIGLTEETFAGISILIVGDVMLDRYWFGDVDRISPEAPVPVIKVGQSEERPGGAANVAANVAALGARCTLLSVVGDDDAFEAAGDDVDLHHAGAGIEAVFDQLLDHRCGPLDDLTGRDAVDDVARQDPNAAHAQVLLRPPCLAS